jgi:hypothetical protein
MSRRKKLDEGEAIVARAKESLSINTRNMNAVTELLDATLDELEKLRDGRLEAELTERANRLDSILGVMLDREATLKGLLGEKP